jgi:hypothetical protein
MIFEAPEFNSAARAPTKAHAAPGRGPEAQTAPDGRQFFPETGAHPQA